MPDLRVLDGMAGAHRAIAGKSGKSLRLRSYRKFLRNLRMDRIIPVWHHESALSIIDEP
jgi:hypothetical protein